MIDAHFQNKMIERLFIDALQDVLQFDSELNEHCQMAPLNGHCFIWGFLPDIVQAASGHVGRSDGFDFDDILKLWSAQELLRNQNAK